MALTIFKLSEYVNWKAVGGATYISGGGGTPATTVDLSNYYTKANLQIEGQSQVNFANVAEAYHNDTLGLQGGDPTSSEDSSGAIGEYYHLSKAQYDALGQGPDLNFIRSLVEDSEGVVTLVNDEESPGNHKYYGTNLSGVKGFYDLTTGEGDYTFVYSLEESSGGIVNLVNDEDAPGTNMVYGTDINGIKGWYTLTSEGFNPNSNILYWDSVNSYYRPYSDKSSRYVDRNIYGALYNFYVVSATV